MLAKTKKATGIGADDGQQPLLAVVPNLRAFCAFSRRKILISNFCFPSAPPASRLPPRARRLPPSYLILYTPLPKPIMLLLFFICFSASFIVAGLGFSPRS